MDLGLKGRRVIVTGGTRGIGRAIVELLADEGCHVAFCARDGDQVQRTEDMLRSKGIRALGGAVDVSDTGAIGDWINLVAQDLGGVDGFVANVSALANRDVDADWEAGFSTDIMGTVAGVRAAMPFLTQSDDGAIVGISSISGLEVFSDTGPYGPFKSALIHYMSSLSSRFMGDGIRVNSVSPGTVYFEGGFWDKIREADHEKFTAALALNPSGRMAHPAEIARAVVFLLSPAASFISGTNLVVDGAMTRRVQF